jgi:hypothetical protein
LHVLVLITEILDLTTPSAQNPQLSAYRTEVNRPLKCLHKVPELPNGIVHIQHNTVKLFGPIALFSQLCAQRICKSA